MDMEFEAILSGWERIQAEDFAIRIRAIYALPQVAALVSPTHTVMTSPTVLGNAIKNIGPVALASPIAAPGPSVAPGLNAAPSPVIAPSPASASTAVSGSGSNSEDMVDSATDGYDSAGDSEEDDMSSLEDSDGDTSSDAEDDLSAAEDHSDDSSSTEGDDDAGFHDEQSDSGDITTLRALSTRPNISLDLIGDSAVASRLPGFLAEMRAANQELEEEKSAGTLANRRIELDGSNSITENGQHIEMNLALGILEEKSGGVSISGESDSGNEDEKEGIMEKLKGSKRKRGLEDEKDGGAPKIAKIQEV